MKEKNKKTVSIMRTLVMVTLLLTAASLAFSQYDFYYGKNKVMKETFKWRHIETPHFKIYYYTQKEALIKKIAKAAEVSYKQVSDYLNVKVKRKIPVIFYSTKMDFLQTNIVGYVPPSAVAFAEYTSYRVVLQGDAPFDELSRTIIHELGHIFEYEIMGGRTRYISPPGWVMEGFSEFVTDDWNQFALLVVRDMVLAGRIPTMGKNGDLETPYYNSRTIPYDFGHMIYEFLDEKYGRRGIKKLLYSLKGGGILRSVRGSRKNILRALDMTPKIFNYEFGKYVRKRFKKFVLREDPEDYSYIIGPEFPFAYSFSHQVSPSGEMVAVLTANMRSGFLEIVLLSMEDGKVINKLTPGFTSKYDYINFGFDPTDGLSFTWNKESNKLAFFARKGMNDYLVIINVLSGNILKKVKLEGLQLPTSPVFHPEKNEIFFTGQEKTKSYIYSMDLKTAKVRKETAGLLYIKAMDISRDGTRVVFSAKADKHYKLFLGTLDNPEMAKQVTFGEYNDITPSFSGDGRYVYYSSDELGSYNINAVDLQEKMMFRYTDVKTGNFFPIEIPGKEKQVVMSSFYKSQFTLFKKDISTPLEERKIEFEGVDEEALARKEAEAQDITGMDIKFKGKYKPFEKLYIKSLPPINISLGTDGGLWGYSYLTMTDLMGDYNFSLYISTFYGYRSYHLTYLNQKHRLQFFSHLFAYQEVYYYNDFSNIYSLTLRSMYGGEAGVFYPFSRDYRLEFTGSLYKQKENSDIYYGGVELPYGQFFSGWAVPLRVSLVGETTRFGYYMGPNAGHTFKLSFSKYIKAGSKFLDAYTIQGDFRKYFRLNAHTLLALRLNGFKSGGPNALLFWTGGNNTIRSIGFRRATGNNMFLFNAEFRFPLVQQANTVIGGLGPIRGVFFYDLAGVWFNGQKFQMFEKGEGIKLQDAISSYGFGLQFFLFGYPAHVEWIWRTDLKKKAYHGVNFWVGFDF
jgi:hypothetical protein